MTIKDIGINNNNISKCPCNNLFGYFEFLEVIVPGVLDVCEKLCICSREIEGTFVKKMLLKLILPMKGKDLNFLYKKKKKCY